MPWPESCSLVTIITTGMSGGNYLHGLCDRNISLHVGTWSSTSKNKALWKSGLGLRPLKCCCGEILSDFCIGTCEKSPTVRNA